MSEKESGFTPGAIAIIDLARPDRPTLFRIVDTIRDDGRAPEGLTFVPADASPFRCDTLIVAFEVSGRVAAYRVLADRDSAPGD